MNIYILTWKFDSSSILLMRTSNTLYLVDKQREEVLDLKQIINKTIKLHSYDKSKLQQIRQENRIKNIYNHKYFTSNNYHT